MRLPALRREIGAVSGELAVQEFLDRFEADGLVDLVRGRVVGVGEQADVDAPGVTEIQVATRPAHGDTDHGVAIVHRQQPRRLAFAVQTADGVGNARADDGVPQRIMAEERFRPGSELRGVGGDLDPHADHARPQRCCALVIFTPGTAPDGL